MNNIKSGESLTITVSVQKSQKPLSPCSLPPAPCGFNDKSLAGHDINLSVLGRFIGVDFLIMRRRSPPQASQSNVLLLGLYHSLLQELQYCNVILNESARHQVDWQSVQQLEILFQRLVEIANWLAPGYL